MGRALANFQAVGKYPNIRICLKNRIRWMRALRERHCSITAEIQFVLGADLVLRN
jgi:hypothetical protein